MNEKQRFFLQFSAICTKATITLEKEEIQQSQCSSFYFYKIRSAEPIINTGLSVPCKYKYTYIMYIVYNIVVVVYLDGVDVGMAIDHVVGGQKTLARSISIHHLRKHNQLQKSEILTSCYTKFRKNLEQSKLRFCCSNLFLS